MRLDVRSADLSRVVEIRQTPDGLEAICDRRSVRVDLLPVTGDRYLLRVDGRRFEVDMSAGSDRIRVVLGPEIYTVEVRQHLPFARRSAATRAAQAIASPMPGLVVAVHVAPGDTIVEGQPVATLEAMKMQMEIRAPRAGAVRRVSARPGQEVAGGQALVEIEG